SRVHMPIPMTCPHCGSNYRLADHAAGQKVRCTNCKQVFTVPAAKAPATSPAAARRSAPTDVAVEPVPPAMRPAPSKARKAATSPRPRPPKKTASGQSSGSLLLPLLVGGAGLALVLFVACGGALWLIFHDSKPAKLSDTPVAVNNPPAPNNPLP